MATLPTGTSINYGSVLPASAASVDGALFFLSESYIDNAGSPSNPGAAITRTPGLYMYNFQQDFNTVLIGDQVGQGWQQISNLKNFVELTGTNAGTGPVTGQIVSTFPNAGLSLQSITPALHFKETDQPADAKDWILMADNGSFVLQARNESLGITQSTPFAVTRAGAATINGNTVWHSGNDGASSGLDADLLDGQDSTFYRNPANLSVVVPTTKGGTGISTVNQGGVVYGAFPNAYGVTPAGTVGQVLVSNALAGPQWVNASTLITAPSVTVGGTPPATPNIGDQWFEDVSTLNTYIWNGSAWIDNSPSMGSTGGGGAIVTVSATAPASPATGNLWFENGTTGRGYIWDGFTWADFAPGAAGGVTVSATAPATPAIGNLWYENNTTGRAYVWNGSTWLDIAPALPGPTGPTGATGPTGPAGPSSGLGIGQTWQNMSGSRALGTTYTNSTGKPIEVSVIAYGHPTIYYLGFTTIVVSGLSIAQGTSTNGGTTPSQGATVIVPDGATYSATATGGLVSWMELR